METVKAKFITELSLKAKTHTKENTIEEFAYKGSNPRGQCVILWPEERAWITVKPSSR